MSRVVLAHSSGYKGDVVKNPVKRRPLVGFELFSKEEQVLANGKELARIATNDHAAIAEPVRELVDAYQKLLKMTKKIVRISDQNEDKLNRMTKVLAQKNALLEEQKLELVKAAELREEVGRISRHDLKNPLQSILSVPELLLMTLDLEDYQRDMLKRVEESGYAMLNMINLSLDMFKMEQGIYTLQAEPVDLLKVVRKVIADQESVWSSKDMDIALLLDGDVAGPTARMIVSGEELLCYSMLSNLIRNALDASPEGERLAIRLDSQGGALSIHNMGAVPEDIRDSFFEKYATSGKARGTGLGTYSAKMIAEVHGGSIDFTTSEAAGTTVTVVLPLHPVKK
jgi:signal transduction histidine kinase